MDRHARSLVVAAHPGSRAEFRGKVAVAVEIDVAAQRCVALGGRSFARRGAVLGWALGCVLLAGCLEKVPTTDTGSTAGATPAVHEIQTAQGVPMIGLAGGQFSMGNAEGAADEQPVHLVEVGPFAIDKYEVTQDQYARLELPNPAHFKAERRPVEQVRWSDAALFCNERSRAEGREPCYDEATFACNFAANGYRLPTEAEWEYAARAGSTANEPSSGAPATLTAQACYAGNSGDQTQVVGSRRANAWGLHDMLGNVAEWCHDVYAADYYASSPSVDPQGPAEGAQRVLRGGSWKSPADACRVSARAADDPGISDACFARDTYGFRCVRRLDAAEQPLGGAPQP